MARNESPAAAVKIEEADGDDEFERGLDKKKRKLGINELLKLGVDSSILCNLDGPRLRDSRSNHKLDRSKNGEKLRLKKRNSSVSCEKILSDPSSVKKWVGYVFSLGFQFFLLLFLVERVSILKQLVLEKVLMVDFQQVEFQRC